MASVRILNGTTLDDWLFRCWLSALIWAPIPVGSNRPWSWAILQLLVFATAALWLVAASMGWVKVSDPARRAKGLFILLALWLFYEALYLVPVPPGLLALLSPEAARLHLAAGTLAASESWKTLSVDPYAAKVSWLKSLLYMLSFSLTLLLVNSRARARTVSYALVITGVLFATYAVLMHLAVVSITWFGVPQEHGPRAIGTFANPNHLAGWLEMALALGIGLLIADLRDRRAETWKQFFRQLIEWVLSPKMRLRLMLCVMVIGLVATRSRMGNTAFFSSLAIAGLIGIVLSRHATRGTVILLISLIAIDVFIVGSWFGVEKLAKRIEQTTLERKADQNQESFEDRSAAGRYGINLVKDYPAFGTGPGSWYVAFPRYRSGEIVKFYDEAHNDYVQFLAENGAIGVGILGAFVAWCLAAALRAQYLRRDPLMRGMSFAAIMGISAMLIHAWVEFNMQIPANAMLLMVILGMGWISFHLERRGQ